MSIDFLQPLAEKVLNNPKDSEPKEVQLAILYELKSLNDKFFLIKEELNTYNNRLVSAENKLNSHADFHTQQKAYYRSSVVFVGLIAFITTLLTNIGVAVFKK